MRHTPSDFRRPTPRRTVMALHCSGAGGRVFDSYRALLDADTELIAPDLLGSGAEAPWPLRAPVTLDAEAERLAPLLARAPQGVHLIGHSYGGAVALQLALRWPQRVLSLTLYEPVRFRLLPEWSPAWDEIVRIGRRIGELVVAGQADASAQLFVDYWSGAGTWAGLPTPRRAALAARMPKVREEFKALFSDAVPPLDYAALTMPMTLLVGHRSPQPARYVSKHLALVCGHALRVRVPGRGHMGALEDPGVVLQQLPWARPVLSEAA